MIDFPFFIEGQAVGALPNGARIVKCGTIAGEDAHQDGSPGTIVSSFGPVPLTSLPVEFRVPGNEYGYFVEWDDMPETPVACAGSRIRPAT